MPPKAAVDKTIELKRIEEAELQVPIVGATPLIPHAWTAKALRMMAAKQANPGLRAPKEPRDDAAIEQERNESCYWLPDGRPGMPATAFKAAMVDACRLFDGLPMTAARTLLFVVGEGPDQLVAVDGQMHPRTDTPRNADGVADLRYRWMIDPWKAVLTVRFVPSKITADSIVALVDAGGRGGVGDWRPSSPKSKTGTYGQFRVTS